MRAAILVWYPHKFRPLMKSKTLSYPFIRHNNKFLSLFRKQHNNAKKEEKEIQTNRMKKMSIEGMSIVGEKPAVKRTPIPVCIAIEEENTEQDHIKLSMEENSNSYTNPWNPRKEEQNAFASKYPIEIV